MQHSAASDLGLHCLAMSHIKEARLIWVKTNINGAQKLDSFYLMKLKLL